MQVKLFHGFDKFRETVFWGEPSPDVAETVGAILKDIRSRGDMAVREYTEGFDGVWVEDFRVPQAQLQQALDAVDVELLNVLEQAAANIRRFHERQKTDSQLDFSPDGTILGWKVTPVDSAGVYIPGGRAFYPSSLLMNVIPAQVAGVPRIAMVSPPGKDGRPHKLVMACAALLGVSELYAVGGAQAVGALTYGTESIPKVVKITGPGNAYVTEAKRQVYGLVGIDSFAGPSEIMIVCDREDLPTEYLVRDLLSQAEHDPEAGAILVTTSATQAEAVRKRLVELVPTLPRREILQASFAYRSALIVVESLEESFEVVNELAPEHLELLTQNPLEDIVQIRNAGAIFLGADTPEPVGDYFAGPNHTLPTSGCAKFASPLGVPDFVKTSSILRYSPQRLQQDGPAIIRFAEEEHLHAHAAAVRVRLDAYGKGQRF
ncbi:MAG: histidinol dehydrogenase [Deltaproteobacteria bacterium]|nr:histidinol dehydrogenase [Deltaproteobacteria bacterium]